MIGCSGKSIFTDLLELDPEIKVVRLQIDYYRSFKYYSAKQISEYKNKYGVPDVILLDAAKDEESKFLHEIYGVLEEINNGRIEGQFGGRQVKDRIPRNIPMIIFSNSPPIIGALSEDRWDIMALYEYLGEVNQPRNIYIQKATVASNIHKVKHNTVFWQNFTQTVLQTDFELEYESDQLLMEMQVKNENKKDSGGGIVKKWGPNKEAPFNKAPSYVKIQALNQGKLLGKY